jgi:hypothetical protein
VARMGLRWSRRMYKTRKDVFTSKEAMMYKAMTANEARPRMSRSLEGTSVWEARVRQRKQTTAIRRLLTVLPESVVRAENVYRRKPSGCDLWSSVSIRPKGMHNMSERTAPRTISTVSG